MSDFGLVVTESPACLPVSVQEAKIHLRVTSDDEDTLIESLVAAATERFERTTGLQLIEASFRLVLDEFPRSNHPIRIPRSPLRSVQSIKYVDAGGVLQTLAADQYVVTTSRQPALIRPAWELMWPVFRSQPDAVQIEYTAGYADADDVPQLAKSGILLMVGAMFEHREDIADRQSYPLPLGAERIMQLYDQGDELLEYGAILYGERRCGESSIL